LLFWNLLDGGPSRNGPSMGLLSPCEVVPWVLILVKAVGHLHAMEQRKKLSPSKDSEGRLPLMEEWMARMKTRDGYGSTAGAHSGGGSNIGGKNAGKNKGQKQSPDGGQKSTAGHEDVCNYCSKCIHWAKKCRKKKRDEAAQAQVAQGEEEEQSLLLAHCTTHDDPIGVNPTPAAIPTLPATPCRTASSTSTSRRSSLT
jgi:hypothetical protein